VNYDIKNYKIKDVVWDSTSDVVANQIVDFSWHLTWDAIVPPVSRKYNEL